MAVGGYLAVLGRAAVLNRSEISVVEVIALAPPRAEPWLVEAVAGHNLDGLDAFLDTGLVADGGGGLSFRHELARIAVEEATPATRRRALHGQILAALADRPVRSSITLASRTTPKGRSDAAAVQAFAPLRPPVLLRPVRTVRPLLTTRARFASTRA